MHRDNGKREKRYGYEYDEQPRRRQPQEEYYDRRRYDDHKDIKASDEPAPHRNERDWRDEEWHDEHWEHDTAKRNKREYPDDGIAEREWGEGEYNGVDYDARDTERKKPNRKKALKTAIAVVLISISAVVIVALIWFFARPTDGGEYYQQNGRLPEVAKITQTNAFDESAWLSWEPVDSVAGYQIYRMDEQTGDYIFQKTAYFSWAIITGLPQGSSGTYAIRPFCSTEDGYYYEEGFVPFTVKTKPEAMGELELISASDVEVTMSLGEAKGADGYEVHRYSGSWWSWELCGETASGSDVAAVGLESATEYEFKARPYIEAGGERYYGEWSDIRTFATNPAQVQGAAQGDTLMSGYEISWTACPRVAGYEIYDCTGEEGVLIGSSESAAYSVGGLETATRRSYRIRAYADFDSGRSYGEYSDVLSTVTLPAGVSGLDQFTAQSGVYSLDWTAVERADGYLLYGYRCHTGEYELISTEDSNSFELKEISQYAERYRVCAYADLDGTYYCGDFSEELSCYPYANMKRTVTVSAASTGIFTDAGAEFEQLSTVARGKNLRVFGEKSGSDGNRWFRVELSDGSTGWLAREDVNVTNALSQLELRSDTAANPPVIYISPSRQDKNFYCIGDTTEKEQMEAVGNLAAKKLAESYNCVVYVATPELSLRERAFEALELDSDVYFAIHSNATGGGAVRYGASTYYYPASQTALKLAKSVNKHLGAIAPKKCNLDKQLYDALASFGGVGYAEVRDPANLGIISLLAETDFHDNELTAQWIIDNHEGIAQAYADAIAEALKLEKKN